MGMIKRVSKEDSRLLQAGYQVGSLTDCLLGIQHTLNQHLAIHSISITNHAGQVSLTVPCAPFSKQQMTQLFNEPFWSHLVACSQKVSIMAESTDCVKASFIEWPGGQSLSLGRSHLKSVVIVSIAGLFVKLPVRQARLKENTEWTQALKNLSGRVAFNGCTVMTAEPSSLIRPQLPLKTQPPLVLNQIGPTLSMPHPSKALLSKCQARSWKCSDEMAFRELAQLRPSDLKHLGLIGQFNREFIAALHPRTKVIWLFDQHAIHERIRLERLTVGDWSRNQDEACHGAIKFGQPLQVKEMQSLLADLAKCQHPFICAHGRPSCYPVVKVG